VRVLDGPTRAFHVGRFAREVLLHAVRTCPLRDDDPVQAALVTVLVDQLRRLPDAPLWLPHPADPRARAFADAAHTDPSASTIVLAAGSGAAVRTLERLFRDQTGLSLGAWRRRARVLDALEPLAAGATVTAAALGAGYSTPSAFVTAFRAELGTTPRRFLRQP
jgi:AraC-like DNA-binding protein